MTNKTRSSRRRSAARPRRPARAGVRVAGLLVVTAALGLPACAARLGPEGRPAPSPVAARPATATPDVSAGRDRALDLAAEARRLTSRDFVTRSRAAERLVAAGEAALPVLGQAGDLPVGTPGGQRVFASAPVVAQVLSGLEPARLLVWLDGAWPVVRRASAEQLGRRGRWSAVPRLIDHLDDPDAGVRAASASAARRLTNRFFGFRAEAPATLRASAVRRWRAWWSIEGRRDDGRRGRDGST